VIGIFIAAAFGLKDLIARYQIGVVPPIVAASLILGAFLILSEHQLTYWRSDETLFAHALAVTKDNGPAHNNLGIALAKQGRKAEASIHFQEAMRLEPLWADPYNNLGNLLNSSGHLEEALVQFSKAAQLKPRNPVMRVNLGEVLSELGRFDEGLSQLNEAVRLDPAYAWPHFQLAKVFLGQGRDAEAIEQCREALRLDPFNVQILTFTARVMAAEEHQELRDGQAALAIATKAGELARGQPDVLDVLGMAFADTGDFANAQTVTSRAIEVATAAKLPNIEHMRQRLELYKQQQPWRESFRSTNAPPKQILRN
jgi:tetratricopeptide (TPR) repeat protein